MEIIFITVPVTLIFIAVGASIFFWASKKGQFDDLDSPAHRILFDDDIQPPKENKDAQTDQDEQSENKDSK